MMNRSLFILIFPFLYSFTFSPMSQNIELSDKRKASQFLIENDGALSIAVELIVKERIMDESGAETLQDTKDLKIFPPQIIVPPGDKRTIRVNYTGPEDLKIEKNYRVVAEQLPLNVDEKTKNKAGIQMLMKYVAALYVSPEDTKPDLKVISHTSDGNEIKLIIHNQGGRHKLLNSPILKYSEKDKKKEIPTSEMVGVAGENVLAGMKRTFTFKSKKVIPKDAAVEIKIND
jgi:fimbrial chaperone protein